MTRWDLSIPDSTDRIVRRQLARSGAGDEELSRFVDEAVRREVLRRTISEIRSRSTDIGAEEVARLAEEAVTWAGLSASG